jgi:uncharacterized protein
MIVLVYKKKRVIDMNIDLSKIDYSSNSKIDIKDSITLDKKYYENTDIRSLSNVNINGNVSKSAAGTYKLDLNISGEMILPCAISLNDVRYPFNIKIDEIVDEDSEENEDYLKIINNSLDIMPIIWQNIVVEIPTKVVSPEFENVKLEGDGWELLTEEEKMQEIDPRLEKLKDLLND